MISRILVVDDSDYDRKSIRKTIFKANNNIEVIEANSLGSMYKYLDGTIDMLIQDISLDSSNPMDSSGLNALYDVIENYPMLPIVILTGHYHDKVKEYHSGYIRKSGHIIDYVAKSDYDVKLICDIIDEANIFIEKATKRFEESKTIDEMLNDLAALEKHNNELITKANEVDKLKLYCIAYSKDISFDSISAEAILTGGYSHFNAVRLCIDIEKALKRYTIHLEESNFSNRLNDLSLRYLDVYNNYKKISSSWRIRNLIVHESYKPQKTETLQLYEIYNVLMQLH